MYSRILNDIIFYFDKGVLKSKPLNMGVSKIKVAMIMDTAFSFPPTTGFNYRVYHLTKYLQKHGIEVIWVLPNRGVNSTEDIKNLESTQIPMYILPVDIFYNKADIGKFIKDNQITVVQFESAQTFMEIGVFLQESLNIPVLLEFHDIEATLRETINAKESVEVLEYTQYISSILADHIICFTDLDKQHLLDRLYVPDDKITLIPNGIREEDFPIMHADKSQTLVFVGNLFYLPNQESLVYILDKVFPSILEEYPNVKIKVIGMTPNSLIERYQKSLNINFLGEITNQEIYLKELQSSLIGLSLIFSGSGMNIKNLNYAGAGLAIVTTPLGANGYEYLSSLSIVEPEIDKITDSIKLLLSDEKSTREKGLSLRDETILWYNWNDISKNHISILEKISLYNIQDKYQVHTDLRPFWLQEKRVKKGKIEKTIRINL